MPTNKDGLESGQPVDFETLMRIKRDQREAAKNVESKPRRGKGKATSRKEVRESDESGLQGVSDSEES